MNQPESSKAALFSLPFSPAPAGERRHELSAIWWLWLPIAFFLLRYAVSIVSDKQGGLESLMDGELGIVENLTVLLLLAAMVGSIVLIRKYRNEFKLPPKAFLIIFSLGCLYFAGEEASWGQHWVGWETGQYFAEINDQNETNFHNTSKYLDRVPKGIVSLAVFLGGLAIPLYLRRTNKVIDQGKPLWWLFPTWVCVPTSIVAVAATWPSKIERATDSVFYFDGAQEMKELYIAYFFLLYIVSLGRRLQQYRASGTRFSAI